MLKQSRLFAWKVFAIKKRTGKSVWIELILPLLMLGICVVTRQAYVVDGSTDIPTITTHDEDLYELSDWDYLDSTRFALVGSDTQGLNDFIKTTLGNGTLISTFNSDKELDSYVGSVEKQESIGFDVAISILSDSEYALRFPSGSVPSVKSTVQSDAFLASISSEYAYRFSRVQCLVDNFLIGSPIECGAQQMPFAMPASGDDFWQNTQFNVVMVYVVAATVYSFSQLVRSIVEEKELKLKECLQMNGMSPDVFWMGWFLSYLCWFALLAVVFALVLGEWVYDKVDFITLLVVMLLFFCNVIVLGMLLSTMCNKAKIANTIAAFLAMGLSYPYFAIHDNEFSAPLNDLVCVSAPFCFLHMQRFFAIAQNESRFVSVSTWATRYNGFSILDYIVMMIVDFLLYSALTWYFDKIMPSEFGSTQKPWFIFTRKFWFPVSTDISEDSVCVPLLRDPEQVSSDYFEDAPRDLNAQLRIRGLTKQFMDDSGSPFTAVDNVSLDIYPDQCFVLLGHNGAGKTTLISMLTGLLDSTSGSASVFGLDLSKEMLRIRKILGVCPQHSILFPKLTVYEHLDFYGRMKGATEEMLRQQLYDLPIAVGLVDKLNCKSEELSGGMQRKLSLAIAFMGDSKVVFLDEPTAGMDAHARRSTWDIIKTLKKGRVIVLTTHLMDEADLLGDRIAILSQGALTCCGSSMFLKNKYGVGYSLILTKSSTYKPSLVSELVHESVPKCTLKQENINQVVYGMPLEASKQFPKLLRQLDDVDQYGVLSYGVSVMTLEEVFIKAGELALPSKPKEDVHIDTALADLEGNNWLSMAFALFLKRVHHAKRDTRTLFSCLITPCISILVVCISLYSSVHSTPGTIAFGVGDDPVSLPIVYDSANSSRANSLSISLSALHPYLMELDSHRMYPCEIGSSLIDSPPSIDEQAGYCISGNGITVLYNSTYVHSLPTYLNILTNDYLGRAGRPPVTTRSSPLPSTKGEKEFMGQVSGITIGLVMVMAFCVIPASFALFVGTERSSHAKHLQLMAGAPLTAYWIANLMFDVLSLLVPFCICSGLFVGFGFSNLVGGSRIFYLLLIFVMFGVSVTPLTYLIGLPFTKPTVAQGIIYNLYIFLTITWYVIQGFYHSDALLFFFRLFPPYSLASALVHLTLLEDSFTVSVISDELLGMVYGFVLYTTLLLIAEYTIATPENLEACAPEHVKANMPVHDSDVIEEIHRLGSTNTDAVAIRGLSKTYQSGLPCFGGSTVRALDDLCFGVQAGECFGFLGNNGAGKTTTLKILTRELAASSGGARVFGAGLDQAISDHLIGYCPQFDALLPNLTAREHLRLFAVLHGVKKESIDEAVDQMLDLLSLHDYADRTCGGYSGGNKRKLSVGLALIGNPRVVLLDEPTTGMDPVSRRAVWDFISQCVAKDGRAVLLTTHSMEEAEALCSRIGVLVNGRLVCLGSPQHLKDKFGDGYSLYLKVEPSQCHMVADQVQHKFNAQLLSLDQPTGTLHFGVPRIGGLALSEIFEFVEDNRDTLGVIEYAVSQTTLEQVFMGFQPVVL